MGLTLMARVPPSMDVRSMGVSFSLPTDQNTVFEKEVSHVGRSFVSPDYKAFVPVTILLYLVWHTPSLSHCVHRKAGPQKLVSSFLRLWGTLPNPLTSFRPTRNQ